MKKGVLTRSWATHCYESCKQDLPWTVLGLLSCLLQKLPVISAALEQTYRGHPASGKAETPGNGNYSSFSCHGWILRSGPQPPPHPALINKYKGNAFPRGPGLSPLASDLPSRGSLQPVAPLPVLRAKAQRRAGSRRLTWPSPAAPARVLLSSAAPRDSLPGHTELIWAPGVQASHMTSARPPRAAQ